MNDFWFLFTDIEGSTSRWEREPQAMAAALRDHDALLREAVTLAGGGVFKTVGDAFCCVFTTARAAAEAAAFAQEGLAAREWPGVGELRVRMAIHGGAAEERDGDYYGPTLNRVARVLSAGHGGQVLLTGATRAALGGWLPDAAALEDLGDRRLKDLLEPERIWQLSLPWHGPIFPPLKTLDSREHNLPIQPTLLIGRDGEVAQVLERFREGARLVTLTGPGGAGKTRLAMQAAAELIDRYAQGVRLIDLSALRDAAGVAPAIAAALRIDLTDPGEAPPGSDPAAAAIFAALAGREVLLLLDNFEQVIDAADFVRNLLASCAGVSLLVTSRIPLRIRAEQEWPVPPLDVPDRRSGAAAVAATAAGQLFADRARAIQPAFRIDEENAGEVAAICRQLDGLPLAIELAAARIRMMTPGMMRERLASRTLDLAGGARDLPDRHRTLEATIGWSYDLLPPAEQALFRQASVFLDPWDGESLAAVADLGGSDPFASLDQLLQHSLVRAEESDAGAMRFRMLETIRTYAGERLAERPDEASAARARHAHRFASLVARHLNDHSARVRGGVYDRHLDDIMQAMDWRLENGAAEGALRTAIALGWYWFYRGQLATAIERLGRLPKDGQQLPPLVQAEGFGLLGLMLLHRRDRKGAREAIDAALDLYRWEGDREGERDVLDHLADLVLELGDVAEARRIRRDLLDQQRVDGPPLAVAVRLNNLAEVEELAGDDAGALDMLQEALGIARREQDPYWISLCGGNLASLLAAVSLAPAGDDLTGYALAGGLDRSSMLCREALTYSRETGDSQGVLVGLLTAAALAAREQPVEAAWLAGGALALAERSGIAISGVEERRWEAISVLLAGTLGAERYGRELAAGAAMADEMLMELALRWCGGGRIEDGELSA